MFHPCITPDLCMATHKASSSSNLAGQLCHYRKRLVLLLNWQLLLATFVNGSCATLFIIYEMLQFNWQMSRATFLQSNFDGSRSGDFGQMFNPSGFFKWNVTIQKCHVYATIYLTRVVCYFFYQLSALNRCAYHFVLL